MANLPTNSLKQEELVGKFQIDDQSNDCFKLNQGIKYPGDLSEFLPVISDNATNITNPDDISNIIDSFQTPSQSNTNSVWNAFNEEEQIPPKPEAFSFDSDEVLPPKPEAFSFDSDEVLPPKPEAFSFDNEEKEEITAYKPFNYQDESEELVNNPEIPSIPENFQELESNDFSNNIDSSLEDITLNNKTEDKIFENINGYNTENKEELTAKPETEQLDEFGINLLSDDLKNLIEQDLNRTKKKRPDKEKELDNKELTEDEIKDKILNFQPIDDLPKSKQFNFEEIEAEHPSAANKVDVAVTDVFTKEEQKEIKKIKKEKINEEKVKKEKVKKEKPITEKKKRAIPYSLIWRKTRLPLLIAVLIAAIASYIYINPSIVDDIKNYFTSSDDTTKVPEIANIDTLSKKELDTVNRHIKDTTNIITKKDADTLQKEVDTAVSLKNYTIPAKEVKEKETKTQPPITKNIPTQAKHKSEVKRIIIPTNVDEDNEPLVTKKHIKKKKTAEKTKRDYTKKDKKKIDILTPETKKEENVALNKENKTDIITSKKIENAIYSVEIYSSQSKEDAEEWQKKLQRRGVKTNIVKHYIRDILWYKVRFGAYPTKSEAAAEARNLGFSTFWIDRIK
ncbi:MAG TPA: SPOR domain-containing protein [Candidatus Kapabacteria bacterium]|nr:SPOR domain-containing protein [Candidatus Kapabacteria bacterium]